MNERTGELNKLDKLMLVNTAMFYKMMLEDDTREKEWETRLDRIEKKVDFLISELTKNE